MRVLVATTAGAGHFGPMVPFARALANAGHDVSVAAPASFAATLERAGFVHRPFADASPEALGKVFAGLQEVTNEEGNEIVVREVFGRLDAQAALPAMKMLVADWRPDLVLRETSEISSYVAAQAAGVPCAEVAAGLASFEDRFLPVLEDPLAELGATGGVARLRAAPRLTLLPEGFEGEAAGGAGARTTMRFRDDEESTGEPNPLPDWWNASDDPLVYVTFGSVAASIGLFPGLYMAVLAGLAELPIRVLLTTGEAGDPQALEPVPANVHVERWWPQQAVMPHAAAVVGHGGLGTTFLALAAGLPQVVLPLFADQPHNAARVEAVGAGIALDGAGAAADGRLPSAVQQVLGQNGYRESARRMAQEIRTLPPVADAVPLLEEFAAGGA